MSGDLLPANARAAGFRLRPVFLPLLKLRIVCEPKGRPFMVSSNNELEMPGQVRPRTMAA
jgi:hypothetical protein